jgi:drug/metabolite transporter (DMT)-like permease
VANLVWGIGPSLTLAVDMSINSTIFYRVLLWPFVLFAIAKTRKAPLNFATLKVSIFPGIFFSISTIFAFVSFRTTSIANATIIGSVASAITLFVAPYFLHEKITKTQVIFAATSFCGVAMVAFGAGSGGVATLRGDALALANAVFWSGYFVVSKKARVGGINTWSFMFGISVVQAVIAGTWAVITSNDLSSISFRDAGLIVAMTVLSGTIGHTTMVWAQRFVAAGTSSLICLIGPVMSMFFAWVIFAQTIKPWQAIGSAVVLASLALVVRFGTSERVKRDVLSIADPLLNSSP